MHKQLLPTPLFATRLGADRSRMGFTAIEITAVATIIAILALILIPIVRKRVDESKLVAAKEDMTAIAKAEQMAFGFTGHFFRLQDLDRPEPDQTIAQTDSLYQKEMLKLPPAYWERPVYANEIPNLYENFKGPFLAMHKSYYISDLLNTTQDLFSQTAAAGGPILLYMQSDDKDWVGVTGGLTRRNHPIDPWGHPYLFFGTSPTSNQYDPNYAKMPAAETDYVKFGTCIVYSTGPDGQPGDNGLSGNGQPPQNNPYFRGSGVLGQGDDLKYEF